MANRQPASALRQLRTLFAEGTTTGLTDSQLLRRFAAKRAESSESAAAAEIAFASLVDRHGAMVWGVCRRVLRDNHEAEDAFQATFLVLVRRAGSVRVDESLGRWLYGVAHRVARRARFETERRANRPGLSAPDAPTDPAVDVERREIGDALNEEVDRLPLKYRCPIELCYLQGMTYDQAARQLDWPTATIKSRLARGRLRLRRSLVRRGLTPSVLATVAAESRAAVPPVIVKSTVRAAASLGVGVIPPTVTTLFEGVLKMMALEKIGLAAAGAVVALGLTAAGMTQLPPQRRVSSSQSPAIGTRPQDKPNRPVAMDSRWVKSLPNGATIEVVGVSTHPSGPRTWWHPNGTPLEQPPCDPSDAKISSGDLRGARSVVVRSGTSSAKPSSDESFVARSIVVRISGVPAGLEHMWSIHYGQQVSKGIAKRNGKAVPDLSESTVLFERERKSCTIYFQVHTSPWKTMRMFGKSESASGSISGPSFITSEAIATEKGTKWTITHNFPDDKPFRVVAIDQNDVEHPARNHSGLGVPSFQQLNMEFDLLPDQIKQFLVQTRGLEKIEIPNIMLDPAGPS
ncbi:ECF RNA polymerase sigma factor SigW [Paludisphaera borealis]|uniref:ECF RNA polymerase sigma factor SigW n=1 Tax=Paludisphaera borealis TaxID=1387353 RepID=A0A1U7CV10_9BACT|nr:sigma-70 family RNA polymerase sigma factor [Paludisphaera borealis]APW62736.1 ECF RNA polymerase sigma factor SigW [Paludisphaera borealis]